MDRTVPRGAAILLDFIGRVEVGTPSPEGYNVIFGFNQKRISKPITQMTLVELQNDQQWWTRRFGSSAAGRYQIMRATLSDLRRELGLRDKQIFDPDLQDRLAYHLLLRRGYIDFVTNSISRVEFGKRLAKEWASLPVLEDCQGAHRPLKRGQSYYTGDPLNKALVIPETVEARLAEVLSISRDVKPLTPQPPQPEAQPPQVPPGKIIVYGPDNDVSHWPVALIVIAAIAAFAFAFALFG